MRKAWFFMKYPEIDRRTKQDIVMQMKKLAASYTPEWRFDEANPDVGTALSYIYADMFEGTLRRFNRVAEKNMIAFFDRAGATLMPSIPATGYVSFSLVNDSVSGTRVKKGTKVLSQEVDGQGKQVFETENDLFVTPANISDVWMTNGEKDSIYSIFEKNGEQECPSFRLFQERDENLQEHILYFCNETVLNIKKCAVLSINFKQYRQTELSSDWAEKLLDEKLVTFEYSTNDGYIAFPSRKINGNRLEFTMETAAPSIEKRVEQGIENYWIRMIIHDIHSFETLYLNQILIGGRGRNLKPEVINTDGVDQNTAQFYPFGERFSVFSEAYFACDEALSKKGSRITMDFQLSFHRIAIDTPIEQPTINWKPIMKKSAFAGVPEYDITIEQVIWEYFNGDGWHRLFLDDSYSDVFGTKMGTAERKVTLSFICPEDMEEILINATSSHYIRARVVKVNNAYKLNGYYVTPYMEEVRFQYDYMNQLKNPEHYFIKNNLVTTYLDGKKMATGSSKWRPFEGISIKRNALYFGFETPVRDGPIRILFQTAETISTPMPRLQIEYSCSDGWKTLNTLDETENFRKTGILTLMGNADFESLELMGKRRYWIRFMDSDNSEGSYKEHLPQIDKIILNTTEITAIETMPQEHFFIEPKEENHTCKLQFDKVYQVSVWVNEQSILGKSERENVIKTNEVRTVKNENGELVEFWVQWKEVESFAMSEPSDRHYIVDKINGVVQFSDGRHGAIPNSGEQETILVEYSHGGGEQGNVKENTIVSLAESIGFINQVSNPLHTGGGCNQETIYEAVARNASALRHGNRAVTAKDYEALVMAATRNILKAKCFPNTNEYGEHKPGCITVVILQKQFESQGQFFDTVKEQVIRSMKNAISGNLMALNHFYVAKPRFLYLNVNVVLLVREYGMVFDVKDAVSNCLEEFLHPVTGNFDHNGFEIGVIPNITQITNAIKTVPNILYIKDVRMTAYTKEKGELMEEDLDLQDQNRFALALSGTHTVSIEVDNA